MICAEAGFNGLFFFDFFVLGVDEGFALIAVGGILAYFFSSGDAVNGFIVANDGQILIERLFAFFALDDQIIDPMLFFV